MKRCPKCKKVKSNASFHKKKSSKIGLQSWCINCKNKNRHIWEMSDKGRLSARRYRLKYHYGLTLKQHKEMYLEQNGCCAICNKSIPYDKVHTDHRHSDGKMRGLLCIRCNTMLGVFETAPELVPKILEYMERYK